MTPSRNCTAIKAGVSLALLFIATAASAAPVGTVTELDGNLLVSRANGSVKVLGVGSAIEEGDILASRKATYVTLWLADMSSVTLGPDTNLKVERFAFTEDAPVNDGALLALAKGSVRITAGLLGTRSGDTFTLATPTATLVVTGANVIAEYVASDAAQLTRHDTSPRASGAAGMVPVRYAPGADSGFVRTASLPNALRLAQVQSPVRPNVGAMPPSLSPGLYVHVIDGLIHMANSGGSQSFSAGQFGYTANTRLPPVVVPANPGLKFTPPPTFSNSMGAQGTQGGSKANQVDCEVR